MNEIQLGHVALLVPSVRKAADNLRKLDFQIGIEEEFEGEGTREVYIEGNRPNSLLLMEPLKDGPYKRALQKRGPGIHHIAIDVLNLELYLGSIASSGWLLHPMSIKTIKEAHTAYLARPGFPTLIEVHEQIKLEQKSQPLFVNQIKFSFDSKLLRLLPPIGCSKLISQTENEITLMLDEHTIRFMDLI